MRSLAAATLVMLTAPALAQGYSRPDIVRGLCQKDGCDEFSVLRADRVRSNEEGTLVRTHVRTYHASGRGRTETGDETGYVFCSPARPTILAESDETFAGFQIATSPSQETRETIRQQSNFYSMYFTICHGPDAGRAAVHHMAGVARQYGYRSPLAKSVKVTFASPDEVFSGQPQWTERENGSGALGRSMAGARNDDPVPPRAVPEFRERPVHGDADRRRDEPLAERGGVGGNDDIVVFETRRPAVEVRPWYREPQRWIESLNPF